MFGGGGTKQGQSFETEQVTGSVARSGRERRSRGSGRFVAVSDELKIGGGFALAAHAIQAGVFLAVIYLFPTHVLILPTLVTSVAILVACLILDKKFAPNTGKDQTAFRAAVGYGWLVGALLFSVIGLIGGKIFSCVGKKNCTTDYMFDMMKMYAVIAIVQGVILAGLMVGIILIRKRRMIEARKTTSIHISKPKMPGN